MRETDRATGDAAVRRSVAMLIEHDGDLIWPMTRLRSEVLGAEQRALAFAEVPDTVALLAWLHRDALIKRLGC